MAAFPFPPHAMVQSNINELALARGIRMPCL
jgi:hypothetical protein